MKKYSWPILLTLICPGLGHIYLKEKAYGISIMIVYLLCLLTVIGIPIAILISTLSIVEIVNMVKKQNQK